ncbi:neprilysin-1-like [Ornithodoros turicata]|uniref:neprilysin-1-like n=1 Tax=Ornithodoros turicata TaxID=34597 RepID=UPI003139E8F2
MSSCVERSSDIEIFPLQTESSGGRLVTVTEDSKASTDSRSPVACILAAISFVALIVVVVVAVVLKQQTRRYFTAHRNCKVCLGHEYSILDGINYTFNPCNNFYGFVCGSWRSAKSAASHLEATLAQDMATTLMAIQVPLLGQTAIQKSAALFQSCVRGAQEGQSYHTVFGDLFDSLGLFSSDVHPLTIIANMSLSLRMDLLVSFRLEPAEMKLVIADIDATEWRWLRERLLASGAYHKFVVNGLRTLLRRGNVLKEAARIKAMEETLARRFFTADWAPAEDSWKRMKLRDLANLTGDVSVKQWETSLQPFVFWNITSMSAVEVESENVIVVLNHVLNGIRREDFRILLRWLALRPFYTVLYRNATGASVYGAKGWMEKAIATLCLKESEAAMGFAVAAPLFLKWVTPRSLAAARNLTESIVCSLSAAINSSTWLENTTAATAAQRATSMTVSIEHPKEFSDLEHLNSVYSFVPDLSTDYVENWITVRKSLAEPEGHGLIPWYPVIRGLDRYSSASNHLWISGKRLVPPYFDARSAAAIQGGRLGSAIARLAAMAFTPHTIDSWSDASKEAYRSRYECLMSSYEKSDGKAVEQKFTDAATLNALYRAVELRSGWGDEKLMRFTGPQLFFLGLCYLLCGDSVGSQRCNVPLKNLPGFADAFSCPEGSPMNPRNKCIFW